MERNILPNAQIDPAALKGILKNNAETVNEVMNVVNNNKVVIVGMSLNPFVKKAKRLLDEKKMAYVYLEYGGYFSDWQKRLAIKLWSGWPSFPQVFINGKLIGGYSDLESFLKNNAHM